MKIRKTKGTAVLTGNVVDSLKENSTTNAPSQRAVNEAINSISCNLITDGEETKTGRKVGEKDEYVKRFNILGLPNNNRNIVDLDMPNPEKIALTNITGTAKKITSGYEDIVPITTVVTTLLYRSSEKKLYVDTVKDQSSYNGYVEIYYTYN